MNLLVLSFFSYYFQVQYVHFMQNHFKTVFAQIFKTIAKVSYMMKSIYNELDIKNLKSEFNVSYEETTKEQLV